MKKIIFNIRNYSGLLESREGYAFELSGFKFAISRKRSNTRKWKVTELSSGAAFYEGSIGDTRKSCIAETQKRIEKYGVAVCKERIESYIRTYSNRRQ